MLFVLLKVDLDVSVLHCFDDSLKIPSELGISLKLQIKALIPGVKLTFAASSSFSINKTLHHY